MSDLPRETMADAQKFTAHEEHYKQALTRHVEESNLSSLDKMNNFARYVQRKVLSRFLVRFKLFEQVLNVHGNVIECGVHNGGGLMAYAQFSATLEPFNIQRKIVGFDTFEGFPSVHAKDSGDSHGHKKTGGMAGADELDIAESVRVLDLVRVNGHIPKVELVKGDATRTIPKYVEENPHTVVSLLYLDFDLFEPTAVALKHLFPRIPKGGIVAFDELNSKTWPGETRAVIEEVGLSRLRIQRYPFDSFISFAVIE